MSLTVVTYKPEILDLAYVYVAKARGYYKKHHVNVTIRGAPSDTVEAQILASGRADVVDTGTPAVLTLAGKGQGKIIGSMIKGLDYVLVAKKAIKSITDLEGKTLAITSPGSISQIIPALAMGKKRGDPGKVKYVAAGGLSARGAAVASGKVDATALLSYQVPQLLRKAPSLHVVAHLSRMVSDFVQIAQLASTEALQHKRRAISAYLAAELEAVRWTYAHPEKAAKLARSFVPDTPLSQLLAGYKSYARSNLLLLNGKISRSAFSKTVGVLLRYKQLAHPVSYRDAVDHGPLRQAVARIGRAH